MRSYHYAFFFLYLFAYIQLAPALLQPSLKVERSSSALEKTERDLNVHESAPKLVRHRRFFGAIIAIIGSIISAVAVNVISTQINRAIERSTGSTPPADQKPVIINNIINNNVGVAQALKEQVQRQDWNAGNAIRVSSRGYQCDAAFCREAGDGPSTVGLCSPDICHCTNGQPVVQRCGTGTVFDPLYKVCNWPYNLKICGN